MRAQAAEIGSGKTSARPRYMLRAYRQTAKVFHWLTAVFVLLMIVSGVTAKQIDSGAAADFLMSLHKLMGVLTLIIVVVRIFYRVARMDRDAQKGTHRRPVVHWMLYTALILIPLLGWAGVSDYNARKIFAGYSLPAIWPQNTGYADLLFEVHAYLAFAMLALVAVHIGIAVQDHIMRMRPEGETSERR